jgi:hypothetical protein
VTAIIITDMTPIYISLPGISLINYPIDFLQYLICFNHVIRLFEIALSFKVT